jgi:hypothetical protein
VRRYLVYCQGMKLKQPEAQFRHWAEHLAIVRGDIVVHQATAGLFRPAYLIVRDRVLCQVRGTAAALARLRLCACPPGGVLCGRRRAAAPPRSSADGRPPAGPLLPLPRPQPPSPGASRVRPRACLPLPLAAPSPWTPTRPPPSSPLDPRRPQVLLVVRGTTSMKDLFTSLSGAVKPHHMLRHNAVVLGYSHLGMLAAARWILKQARPALPPPSLARPLSGRPQPTAGAGSRSSALASCQSSCPPRPLTLLGNCCSLLTICIVSPRHPPPPS